MNRLLEQTMTGHKLPNKQERPLLVQAYRKHVDVRDNEVDGGRVQVAGKRKQVP